MLRHRSSNLRRLSLSHVVLEAPVPDTVEVLSISRSILAPSAFQAAQTDTEVQEILPRLRVLRMYRVVVKGQALTAMPHSVESLRIGSNHLISMSCLLQTGVPSVHTRLRELDLGGSWMTFDSLSVVVRVWPQLTTLKLNGATVVNLHHVARLPVLEVLEADRTLCSSSDLRHICTNLVHTLRHLSIASCPRVEPGAFLSLIILRNSLRYLNISSNYITADVLYILNTNLPNCQIVH